MGHKTYSREFKCESAALVLDQGYTLQEACTAVGVGVTAMRRWVSQLQAERSGQTPQKGKALTDEHVEIQKLKKQIKRLEVEKTILKKATALLMSDTLNVTR
jgi:transposase